MKQVITIGTVPHPISAGYEAHEPGEYYDVIRKAGRQAWTFLLIEEGRCFVEIGGDSRIGARGHFYAIEPGMPHHYGTTAVTGTGSDGWTYYWAHIFPKADWEPWLQWPELTPGLRAIVIPASVLPDHIAQFQRVVNALTSQQQHPRALAMAQFETLLIMSNTHNPKCHQVLHDDHPSVEPAFTWIQAHIKENVPIEKLAQLCGMSRSTFGRAFRAATGYPPRDYIERMRVTFACQHLQLTHDSITEIARKTGFRDIFYFSLRFKKMTGLSPLAFRKANAPGLTPKPRQTNRRPTQRHPT